MMAYRLLANLVLLTHFVFVLFAIFGGLLILWRQWMLYLHLSALFWASYVMFTGTICPLTPWENALRRASGSEGYQGGFIEHYIITLLYPDGLTRGSQIFLGIALVMINMMVYAWILLRLYRK